MSHDNLTETHLILVSDILFESLDNLLSIHVLTIPIQVLSKNLYVIESQVSKSRVNATFFPPLAFGAGPVWDV